MSHKTPCAECPFRRASAPGWLGADTPEGFLRTSLSECRMPCHTFVDYDDPDWETVAELAPMCAGRAIFLRNLCKIPRDAEQAEFTKSVKADRETVFARPNEFLDHHINGLDRLKGVASGR